MAELWYRESENAPLPPITTVRQEPLTNLEIDANFRSLNLDIQTKADKANPVLIGTPIIESSTMLVLPRGASSSRPSTADDGSIRYNTELQRFEGKSRGVWDLIGGGATGAPGNSVFHLNDRSVTGNYTIPTNKNAGTFGPVTIQAGVVVNVPSGSVWSIV